MITVQWSEPINNSAHGRIFYRRFYCGNDTITRVYSASDFVLFTPPLSDVVYVAEILNAWKTINRNFVSVRIYAKPENTECGRLPFHGEDELLVLSKIVVITCEQLFQYECCCCDGWNYGTPLHTRTKCCIRQEQESTILLCTETMLPIDKDCLVSDNVNSELTVPKFNVVAVDFQSYCRYKAIIKRISNNNAGLLGSPAFAAMGGILARHPGTFLVFCRKAFCNSQLEKLLSCEGLMMVRASVIKGGPSIEKPIFQNVATKRGESEERDQTWEPPAKKMSVLQDLATSDNNDTSTHPFDYEEIMYDGPMGLPSRKTCLYKKRRGRPRKTPTSKIITINLPVVDTIIATDDNEEYTQSSILIPTCDFSFQQTDCYDNYWVLPTDEEANKQPFTVPTAEYVESCMLKSHLIQQNGDQHYTDNMNETRKDFFESLFTFMIGRNTPITRIPLLGFKKLDLYELFHLTNKLGGYEQVTLSNKWKSVFNALGGREITAAATYTRKHYEKYLLAYEKEVHCGKWVK